MVVGRRSWVPSGNEMSKEMRSSCRECNPGLQVTQQTEASNIPKFDP
jgi:hypothetical protein